MSAKIFLKYVFSLHPTLEFRQKSEIPNFLEKAGHRKSQNFPKFLIFRRSLVIENRKIFQNS